METNLIQAIKNGVVLCVLTLTSLMAMAEPAPSLTTQIEGVTLPKIYQWNDQALPLSGAGLRTQFFFNVAVIALYGSPASSETANPFPINFPAVVNIHFLRDLDWDDITAELDFGLKANQTKEEMAALSPAIKQFDEVIKSAGEIKEGSTLSLLLRDKEVEVRLNKKVLGTNSTQGLSKALLKIWLGEHPIQESVKKALLGKS